VGRVDVINRGPGIKPTYTYRGPSDATPPVTEYQVCFKCHSSWTTQPPGQLDLAVLFNSNNPSYHPVEARGRNRNIHRKSFVNNWIAEKLTYCTDCHSSDDPEVRGPHGSQHRYILKKMYVASSRKRRMSRDEICFDCHRYETYADGRAKKKVKGYSRFNQRATKKGHSFHVGKKQVPCYACHDSHGSTTQPYLIVTGRNPGLTKFTQTRKGGTCESTCHKSKKYKVNYRR
jgi:hypothetical protein